MCRIMRKTAAEIPQTTRVGVEEDSMELAFGDSQGDSGEGIPVLVEDQRRLSVELSTLVWSIQSILRLCSIE